MAALRRPSVAQCRTRSLEEVMKAVIMDNIPLDYGPWLACSPECLDFLKGLLMRDPAQRMTASEALEHPWFRRHFGAPTLPSRAAWHGPAALLRRFRCCCFVLIPLLVLPS